MQPGKTSRNKQLARIFEEMADMTEFLSGDKDRFRAQAYRRAARILEDLPEDIETYLQKHPGARLPGIGERTLEKIREFLQTGTIQKYEQLKKQVPQGLIELMNVPGLGPRTLKLLYDRFGIQDRDSLVRVLRSGEVLRLKGFGPRKVEKILHGLELAESVRKRILYWTAYQLARGIIAHLQKTLPPEIRNQIRIQYAGSLRRGKETIGDIDILVACPSSFRAQITDAFISYEGVQEVLLSGETKTSVILQEEQRQVDLRLVEPDQWGSALQYFTGSKEHNVRLREMAKEQGLKINEYGVFRLSDGEKIAGSSEEEVYQVLGLPWIPPELREDRGEIEHALQGTLPTLIEEHQIRGDFQSHSRWTDGAYSIREIAEFLLEHFPQYEYLLLTDHSQAVRVAGGLSPQQFLQQKEEIDRVNAEIGRKFILWGAEVDILPDGSLDLPDELLAQMDLVVASIHSHMQKDNTERILRACYHPHVHIIGHPTGRLFGVRDGYPLQWERILEACQETGTALEINGQPTRMDLQDTQAYQAREAGIMLALSTDAHTHSNFHYMHIAVKIARRAWCEPAHILNTRSLEELMEWKKEVSDKSRKTRASAWK